MSNSSSLLSNLSGSAVKQAVKQMGGAKVNTGSSSSFKSGGGGIGHLLDSKKGLFKSNTVICIVCALILILVSVIGYKFSKSFLQPGKSVAVVEKKKSPEFKIITPQCVYGSLKNEQIKVMIVNVLSEKMPVLIGVEGPNESKSVSKLAFENILEQNGNQIPKEIDLVVLMCAGWSCGAAKSYFNELVEKNVEVSRVVDYAGGLHEWCVYNKLNAAVFKLFKIRSSDDNEISELSTDEITNLMKDTAHGYKTNTIIENKESPLSELCLLGKELPQLLG